MYLMLLNGRLSKFWAGSLLISVSGQERNSAFCVTWFTKLCILCDFDLLSFWLLGQTYLAFISVPAVSNRFSISEVW